MVILEKKSEKEYMKWLCRYWSSWEVEEKEEKLKEEQE